MRNDALAQMLEVETSLAPWAQVLLGLACGLLFLSVVGWFVLAWMMRDYQTWWGE